MIYYDCANFLWREFCVAGKGFERVELRLIGLEEAKDRK